MSELLLADHTLIDGRFVRDVAVLVGDDGKITAVGPEVSLQVPDGTPRIALSRKALLPGCVNAHNHSFQSLLRGIADDKAFLVWRDQALYRYAPRLGREGTYVGALFAFGEMLLRGVTTVCDFFYLHDDSNDGAEAVIRAARDVGIRLTLARTMYDWDGAPKLFRESVADATRRTRELHAAYRDHPLVRVVPAPHSPHAASSEMVVAGAALAEELDTFFHMHVAEERFEVEETLANYGQTPVRWLESLGVLSPRACLVHCCHVDPGEVALMGEQGVNLLYNPNSNMFLGDGITPLTELLEVGVRVALGTDGGCSNNRVSVFDEMRAAALLQKVRHQNGTALGAEAVFEMGTRNGALLTGWDAGIIAPGRLADLITVDLDDLSTLPHLDLLKNVVYSMESTALSDVMVGGRWVVQGGILQTMSTREIGRRVAEITRDWTVAGS
ncbi:MAG: amidohydrolase [Myxococcales bacterium]|nr:amidohydrolase [Myxococcales bacterium]